MNKLKKLEEILDIRDESIAANPRLTAYENDRLVQGMRYILDQPDEPVELTEDIIKPTASEVRQMIGEMINTHLTNYHSSDI